MSAGSVTLFLFSVPFLLDVEVDVDVGVEVGVGVDLGGPILCTAAADFAFLVLLAGPALGLFNLDGPAIWLTSFQVACGSILSLSWPRTSSFLVESGTSLSLSSRVTTLVASLHVPLACLTNCKSCECSFLDSALPVSL